MGREWLETVFDKETKAKAGGRTRVLILDGHSSHYSLEFIQYARENNILVLGYPPHCTHALQGLDVVCFGKMKVNWANVIDEFEKKHMRDVAKNDFTHLFCTAYKRSFDPDTIKAAFRVTGIVPYDPTVIKTEQMKPSEPHSIKATFPMPQASPVRAVMAAMDANPPTAFEISPSTHMAARRSHARPTTPETPTRPRRTPATPQTSPTRGSTPLIMDPNIDPVLYTPSKRVRSLYSGMSMTSGSFLVNKTKITSDTPILKPVIEVPPPLPLPNWSLLTADAKLDSWRSKEALERENARLRESLHHAGRQMKAKDFVIEGCHAQLIVQDMHLRKVNQALKSKEEKKSEGRKDTITFDKGGNVFTSDEWWEQLVKNKERQDREAAEKSTRASARELNRAARAAAEGEWRLIKELHERKVRDWEKEVERTKEQNIPKKFWPKKPVRPPKPKPVLLPSDGDDTGDVEGDIDGDT